MECASYGQSAQSKETSEGSTVKQNMSNRLTNNTLGELKIAVARELSSIDCQMVATMAGFRLAEKERMKDGISLMDALESKGYFEESEMETLVDLFTKCELHKVAGIIKAYIKVTDKDEKQRKVSDTYRPCAQDLLVRDAAKAPNESKEKIFVSFSFSIKERVMALKDRIETYLGEDTCWICTTGVDGGDNLDTEIVRAIDNADIVLCMINEGFVDSPECEKEVHLSRSKNKHLIPILLENVEWPLKKSSGEPSPMQLAFTQLLYVNLHDQTMKEDEFKKLITTIKKRLALMEEGTLTPRFSTQTQTPHPPPAKSLSPVVKENKTQLVKELRNKYKNLFGKFQPSPLLRDNYDIDKLFVENGIKFLKETHGASDEHERWRTLKDHKTIFTDPQIKSKRFIIDGEPGYGKSALTLQITHDWCQQLKPMDQFQVLILLRLRQLSKVPTIYSAIRKFLLPRDSKLTEDDIKNILDGSSTIVILDGYDEYPDRGQEDTDIEHIIRGDMFQEHVVFLTSRTSCLPSNYSSETKRLRLTGFNATARDNYIQNMVTVGRPQGACKIHQFLKVNTVPADFCKIPLFFAMICYMVLKEERFYNLNTVTEFFEHIIMCFYSHDQIKEVGAETKLDYCTLGKIALEGLSSDSQKLSWEDNDLKGYIGQNLYKQYIRIGILNEEENYDYDSKKYKTEVTFYHKLFAEWFAAHYLAEKAEKHLTKLTKVWRYVRQPTRRRSLHNLLESLNPDDVQFLYRFACGLSPKAAVKIIDYLGENMLYYKYTLLCMAESSASLGKVLNTVLRLCSQTLQIKSTDSLLLQRSTVELIEFASSQKIVMKEIYLRNCLDVGEKGKLCMKPSNLSLPAINTTLTRLVIYEHGLKITDSETDSIFQYSAMCLGLKTLGLGGFLLPHSLKVTESMSILRSRDVAVEWYPGIKDYRLNLETGQWEDCENCSRMTDEHYQRVVEHVGRIEEWRKQRLGKG